MGKGNILNGEHHGNVKLTKQQGKRLLALASSVSEAGVSNVEECLSSLEAAVESLSAHVRSHL
jgi:hypothetical protein